MEQEQTKNAEVSLGSFEDKATSFREFFVFSNGPKGDKSNCRTNMFRRPFSSGRCKRRPRLSRRSEIHSCIRTLRSPTANLTDRVLSD